LTACQKSYPTITHEELQQFIQKGDIEHIVIENQKIAYIDLKNGRAPYDYQMAITSADFFHNQIESYYAASNISREDWVYPALVTRTEPGLQFIFNFGLLVGLLVYIVPIIIIIWMMRVLRRMDRNLQEINQKLQ